jgi:hypothetical protein
MINGERVEWTVRHDDGVIGTAGLVAVFGEDAHGEFQSCVGPTRAISRCRGNCLASDSGCITDRLKDRRTRTRRI